MEEKQTGNQDLEVLDSLILSWDRQGAEGFQRALFECGDGTTLKNLASWIISGQYEAALELSFFSSLLSLPSAELEEQAKKKIAEFIENAATQNEQALRRAIVQYCGVLSLCIFIQANWTGPELHESLMKLGPSKEERKSILQLLSVDGEMAYLHARYVNYLLVAKTVLFDCKDLSYVGKASLWWTARCLMTWQYILSGPAITINTVLEGLFESVVSSFSQQDNNVKIRGMAHLEQGLFWYYYSLPEKSVECFKKAQESTALTLNLTGALGRRTRFQDFDVAQLYLHAASSEDKEKSESVRSELANMEVPNSDDTLLPNTTFTSTVEAQENLRIIDQCIILATCMGRGATTIRHRLTTEEMLPYVNRVLKHPNNWLVHSMALLLKSRLESEPMRTRDRAALQVQALVDQFFDEREKATVHERSEYVFAIAYPPRHELQKEMGLRFLSLGAAATALNIFQDLEMWPQIVECYRIMNKSKKAERVVREQLESGVGGSLAVELWCTLGDITNQPEYWERSWELSECRYSRAQRSLGGYHIKKQDWEAAIKSYSLALAINPLYPNIWFSLGCAAMKISDWELALRAFGRVIQMDYDNGEAWNNLASIHIRLKKKKEAFNALTEALKCSYDNWKMWQNYLYISMDLGEFQQALQAMRRLFDLEAQLDIEVLDMLVSAILDCVNAPVDDDSTDVTPEKEKGVSEEEARPQLSQQLEAMKSNVAELLQAITNKITDNHKLWSIYAKFQFATGHIEQGLDCRLRQMRALTSKEGWAKDKDAFMAVVQASIQLVKAYFAQDPSNRSRHLYSAKLHLKSMLKKTEEVFKGTEAYQLLEATLQKVEEQERKLKGNNNRN